MEFTVHGPAGTLAGIIEVPELEDGHKCPVVIMCHGLKSDCNKPLLLELARDLVRKGIAAARFDFDGTGKSAGLFGDMTIPKQIADLKSVLAWVARQPFTADISLAGHSQGGVVAAMAAGELGYPAIKSLALMAAAAVIRDDALRGMVLGAHFDPWNVPEKVPLPGNDLEVGRDYILTAQNLPVYKTALKYTGPVFILQGEHDVFSPYTYAERFQEGYKNAELKIVPGEVHAFSKFTQADALTVSDFFARVL